MTTISKTILIGAGLSLLAGSPAFAARHDVNAEARQNRLLASPFKYQLPILSSSSDYQLAPLSARGGNSSPYIGTMEGYPRSALR